MSRRLQVWMACFGIVAIVAVIGSTCFSAPTIAHVVNEEVLTIPLEQSKDVEKLQCTLLTEEGRTIFLNGNFSEKKIPITISASSVLDEAEGGLKVTAVTKSSNEERLQASVDFSEFELREESQTMNLTLNLLETEPEEPNPEPEVPEIEEPNPEPEVPETEEPKESEPGTEVLEPGIEVPEPEMQIEEPLMVGTSGEIQLEESAESGNQQETVESEAENQEISDSTTSEDIETEKDSLEVEVELKAGEVIYSATFVIEEEINPEESLGELLYCPGQYHLNGTIELVNNQETETIIGKFPEMTGYELDGKHFLLYEGGYIRLSAGEKIKLDISNTGSKQDLVFYSAGAKEYQIIYTEAPDKLTKSQLLLVHNEEVSLPVNYRWGELTPVVMIEQLKKGEEGLDWNGVETITYSKGEHGEIKLVPNNPSAGTYRALISWIEKDVELYEVEIPFYVQYRSADYGGNG